MSGVDLSKLGLSPEQVAARRHSIGGSDACIIMSGDEERILRLWREKRGEAEPEDLRDNLAVVMGLYTEPLNIAWFEKQTGLAVHEIGRVAEDLRGSPPMSATIDGYVAEAHLVFEAKHTNARFTPEELWDRYTPQLAHNTFLTNARGAVLSVFRGNSDWFMLEYERDLDYEAALIEAEAAFWRCVQSGESPVPLPPPPAPKPAGVREVSMHGSNEWASLAADYIETLLPAQRHEQAKNALKSLMPPDASKCFGHGVIVARDKRGALRISTGDMQ